MRVELVAGLYKCIYKFYILIKIVVIILLSQ